MKALGSLRIAADSAIAERFKIPARQDGTPTMAIDLRDIRELDNLVWTFAAEVSPDGRAYLIVEQGSSGSNDLLYLTERLAVFAQVEKFFRLASAHSLITASEESAASTHRLLASDMQLASPVQAISLAIASGLALARVAWRNWRFGPTAPASPKDPVLVVELRRY
jgi:hypothetical protein